MVVCYIVSVQNRQYYTKKEMEYNMSAELRNEKIKGIMLKFLAISVSLYGVVVGYNNLQTFTFFTTLSNIWIEIILLVSLIFDVMYLKSNGSKNYKNNVFYIIKFMLTISITVTFLVYMFLLAPNSEYGFIGAYTHDYYSSYCVHFSGPILAILDFIIFDYEYESTNIHALYATIPSLIYVLFVTILGYSGMRWYDTMYAPYNFLNFGAKCGWFGYDSHADGSETLGIGVFYMIFVLVLIFIAIGMLFLLIKDRRRASKLH